MHLIFLQIAGVLVTNLVDLVEVITVKMFLVNRTLRSFRTSALHPFRTIALRPPPIAQPLAYYASKRVIHSEFSKADLGTGNAIHPGASQVSPGTGEEVGEEDKADLHPQAKGPGDTREVGLPLFSTTMVQMKLG